MFPENASWELLDEIKQRVGGVGVGGGALQRGRSVGSTKDETESLSDALIQKRGRDWALGLED